MAEFIATHRLQKELQLLQVEQASLNDCLVMAAARDDADGKKIYAERLQVLSRRIKALERQLNVFNPAAK